MIIGLHADAAYDLLELRKREAKSECSSVSCYPTFYFDSHEEVTQLADRCLKLGGAIIKHPFVTYYSQWQTVLSDPEGHVIRLASMATPAGTIAPTL